MRSEISAQQPVLGEVADRLLNEPGVLLAGTIRRDGTARAVTEQDRQERYAAAVREQIGWQPMTGQFTLFIVEVADVTYIGSEPGTGA
jgi:hypothetical protein